MAKNNLVGQHFGKLTVVCDSGKRTSYRAIIWTCRCDCGNTIDVAGASLINGSTKSCGCLNDISGQRFGRLTAIKRAKTESGRYGWLCKCDCGNEVIVITCNLKSGTSTSCGCLQKELTSKRSTTHGMTHQRIYGIWEGIKQRCYNEKVAGYKYYGAKGIKMCDDWVDDFLNFYNWSMSNGYTDDLTIDRIDIEGEYSPSNCRWVEKNTQMNNMSTNVKLLYKGQTKTIAEWARVVGEKPANIYWRHKKGWTIDECLLGKSKKVTCSKPRRTIKM